MSQPKITIVTPNYNMGHFLECTIDSVLSQNYPNIEYIVIDGGSTDNSVEIIRKYEKYLAYWVSESDAGLYDALNKGFSRSTGEILAYINSDDILFKGTLSIVAELFSSFHDVDWITGKRAFIDEADRIIKVDNLIRWSIYDFMLGSHTWIQQESTFWRRSLWLRNGKSFDSSYKYAGDFELWFRFFKTADLYTINTILGGFRIRKKNQISLENIEEYILEVNSCLNDLNMKDVDLKRVKRLKYLKNTGILTAIRNLPIFNNIYHQILQHPPVISYSIKDNIFKIDNR